MTTKQATRRYFQIFVPAMILYLVSTFGLNYLFDQPDIEIHIALKIAMSLVPICALLSLFWTHWRYMNDLDELLREIQIKGAFGGLAIVMLVATGWGALEKILDAPALEVFLLNPIFWVGYSVTTAYFTWRIVGFKE